MRKEDKYRELVRLQEDSGLSVKDFCANQDIGRATFYYWRKKLNSAKQPDGFIPLLVAPGGQNLNPAPQQLDGRATGTDNIAAELAYPNGVVLRLGMGASVSELKALINLEG